MFSRRKPVAYYAHSLRIYGTKTEKQQQRRIHYRGYKVINPNGLLSDVTWKEDAAELIRGADCVICTEYCNYIGRGVDWELRYAFELGKPVYVLRGWRLISLTLNNVEIIGINWAVQWAEIRV
jgi:hypothetical protein